MEVGTLTPGTQVENEECVYCFNDIDHEDGINICLNCFVCTCNHHAMEHTKKTGHSLYFNRRRITIKSETNPDRMAIGVDGGFEDIKRSIDDELRMFDEDGFQVMPYELIEDEAAQSVIQNLRNSVSSSESDQIRSWELQAIECKHVKEIQQDPITTNPPVMHCGSCNLSENLWLCLTCGFVGCGRQYADGSGGNNHAIDHYKQTGHSVVVKLGTITPEGNGDLYCYACDETVHDTHLADHLRTIHVDVASSAKTVATTTELCVKINKEWDFNAVSADGREYEKANGPYSVGLKNLGNTCYMNAVLQLLANIPELCQEMTQHEYQNARWTDPRFQFNRLFSALQEGQRLSVSPRLLRTTALRDRPDYMSGAQQDACEFLLYIFNYIKVHNPNTVLSKAIFDSVDSIICDHCADVKNLPLRDQHLLYLSHVLPRNLDEEETISMESIIHHTLIRAEPERKCEQCNQSSAIAHQLFLNFPDYLIIAVALDTITSTGMYKKMNINIEFDPNNFDLSQYKASPQTINEATSSSNSTDITPAMLQLMEMGFTDEESRDALDETNGNIGLAAEWLFGPRIKSKKTEKTNGNGVYELIGFVQHKGPSALSGHYVANIKRDDHWILYNDEKVSIYPNDVAPQFGKAYLYLFKRK